MAVHSLTHVVALGFEKQPVIVLVFVQEQKRANFLTRWWTRRHGGRIAKSFEYCFSSKSYPVLRLYENEKLVFKSAVGSVKEQDVELLRMHWELHGRARGLQRRSTLTPNFETKDAVIDELVPF